MSENDIVWHQRWQALKLSGWRYWFTLGVIAAVYFGAAKFGLSLAFVDKQVTAIWPPTGIALVTLLLLGTRVATIRPARQSRLHKGQHIRASGRVFSLAFDSK